MHINWAHVHLMINHFPVVGILGNILLLLYAVARKSDEITMVSLGLFVLIALIAIPVFFTGHGAEDVVKKLPGMTETYIGRHEEMADFSIVALEILGGLALLGLVLKKRTGAISSLLIGLVLLTAMITAVLVGITANLGGQIRHSEIRNVDSR